MVKSAKGISDVSLPIYCVIPFADDYPYSQFLNDLEEKLRPVGIKERAILLEMKKKEHETKGFSFDGEFYIWDYRYYDRKYIEEHLQLDDMLVKEYFPVSVVIPAILSIYQNLLGVRFAEIKGTTWHQGLFHMCWLPDDRVYPNYPQTYSNFPFGRRMPKMNLALSVIVTLTCSRVVRLFTGQYRI
jgi:hypothetical protein